MRSRLINGKERFSFEVRVGGVYDEVRSSECLSTLVKYVHNYHTKELNYDAVYYRLDKFGVAYFFFEDGLHKFRITIN